MIITAQRLDGSCFKMDHVPSRKWLMMRAYTIHRIVSVESE